MTPDQYWNGDTWLVRDYLKAEEFRREKENYNAWLNGVYVAKAISATIRQTHTPKDHSRSMVRAKRRRKQGKNVKRTQPKST